MQEGAVACASDRYFAGLKEVLARLDSAVIEQIIEVIWKAHLQGRTIFLFGNGGSAALAAHFACDLAKGTINGNRRRLRAIALTENTPLMTAWANDFDYQSVFAEQLRTFIQKGDVVLAVSGSGNSANVVQGLEVAREMGAFRIALTGFDGGRVKPLCDLCLVVPSDNMQHIEDAHLSSAHAIFTAIRARMHADAG